MKTGEFVELGFRYGVVGAGIGYLAGNWQKGAIIGVGIGLFSAYMQSNASMVTA